MRSSTIRLIRDLKALVEAGAPVRDALEALSRRGGERSAASRLHASVVSGTSLGEAFAAAGGGLPPQYVALVSAGEATGKLETMLGRILEDYEIRSEERRMLLMQVAYPLLVLVFAVVLPPVYLILRGQTGTYVMVQLSFFAPLAVVLLLVLKGPRLVPRIVRGRVEELLLTLPLIGKGILDAVYARTFFLLGTLLEAGLGYAESLPLAGNAARWDTVRRSFLYVDRCLARGKTATESFGGFVGWEGVEGDRLARGETEGMPGRAFLEIAAARRRRHLTRWRVTLRVVPVVVLLLAALIVLRMALQVLPGRYQV